MVDEEENRLHLGFTVRQDYFSHFEPNHSLGGAKTGEARERLITHEKNLVCIPCD